jgi:CHAT domain-containing protein
MRVLIVDDELDWWEALSAVACAAIHADIDCVWASSAEEARALIGRSPFALIFVDLQIPLQRDAEKSPEYGLALMQDIRKSKLNREAAGIVVTAYGTPSSVREALKEQHFSDHLDKADFQKANAKDVIRKALFASAYQRAAAEQAAKFDLTLVLTDSHIVFGQLSGPQRFCDVIPRDSLRFDTRLSDEADRINFFVSGEMRHQTLNEWRQNARQLGTALYTDLFGNDSPFGKLLAAARSGSARPNDLRLCFRGTRTSLRVPFELLHDGDEFLALRYPIVRQTAFGENISRKAASFHNWLKRLDEEDDTLRVLLIASNTGPRIDAVDDEVLQIESRLNQRLGEAGIRKQVVAVRSNEATYTHVETLLQSEKWHIVHYAGHGRWDDGLPENSDLVFQDGADRRSMPTSVLYGLLQNSPTLLFYVSGCLGALMDDRTGRGDFHGLMDGIVQADVPIVVAHRWGVSDAAARDLALSVYDNLFTSWSIEDALSSARHALIRSSPYRRDDPGWASPILVAQTAYYKG